MLRFTNQHAEAITTFTHLHATLIASVPFSWEEKPGLPKKQESNLRVSCVHFPATLCMDQACPPISPFRKPLCLQQVVHDGPPPSFYYSIPAAPRHSCSKHFIRRLSFDSLVFAEYSHECFNMANQSRISRSQRRCYSGMEDDLFFMAIQACREEPIRVVYHNETSRRVCEEERTDRKRNCGSDSQDSREGFEHRTVKELVDRQLQEEAEQYLRRKAKKQAGLVVEGKHGSRLVTFLAECMCCY